MKFFRHPLHIDSKNENRRLLIFAFVLIANLIIIGCLLVAWNVNAVSDDTSYAILIVGAASGLFILFCMVALLMCFASTTPARSMGIQTVYPTPEFSYFSSTMLQRVQRKNEAAALPPFQGSNFSILSTRPATSTVSTITVNQTCRGSNQSYESVGILPYDDRNASRDTGEYMRVY
ncbi:hypothetical protein M3Y97_00781300 [Aphelenchoides bicaudatus]|nr:hypothetical protein M3Y97_00781300 [Aphelenchoides bicaudatus]